MSLYQVTYISRSTLNSNNIHEKLEEIQTIASSKNARKKISGVLVYRAGYFLQRLEGETITIKSLIKKISMDSRHTNFRILEHGEISERQYQDWTQLQLIAKRKDTQPLEQVFAVIAEKSARNLSCDDETSLALDFIKGAKWQAL